MLLVSENHLRSEIDILAKEVQSKDSTIKKLELIIEKLQDDAALRRQTLNEQVRIYTLVIFVGLLSRL